MKSKIILLILIILFSCEREKNNPYDPASETDFSPINLTAVVISPYVIKLQWEVSSSSMDRFKIDRKESSGNWQLDIAEDLGNNTTSWIDYNCLPNTEYTYRVYAVAGNNTSEAKTIIKKTTEGNPTGTFTDNRDGKIYKWVKIGNQAWMAENLAYLPYSCPPDSNCGIWVPYYEQYGCLYDWETANLIAPDGWHLPTEEEWYQLINYLGGPSVAISKLKDAGSDFWGSGNTATNESGFSALPGGNRIFDSFSHIHSLALFWAAIPDWAVDNGMSLQDWQDFTSYGDCYFIYGSDDLNVSNCTFDRGGSVRCIKN